MWWRHVFFFCKYMWHFTFMCGTWVYFANHLMWATLLFWFFFLHIVTGAKTWVASSLFVMKLCFDNEMEALLFFSLLWLQLSRQALCLLRAFKRRQWIYHVGHCGRQTSLSHLFCLCGVSFERWKKCKWNYLKMSEGRYTSLYLCTMFCGDIFF